MPAQDIGFLLIDASKHENHQRAEGDEEAAFLAVHRIATEGQSWSLINFIARIISGLQVFQLLSRHSRLRQDRSTTSLILL